MWSPTHVQVTVQRARGLLIKGKNGMNNCFVTIVLGKEKYQTSVKDKATDSLEWHEECELTIPDKGNRAELVLTCLHRNNLGIDQFLGQVALPLNEMDVYDRPRSKWFKLESKVGQQKDKYRGELEVRILFTVKSGSLSDLSKKDHLKLSVGRIGSSISKSVLSLGTLEKGKGLKKFAKSLGSKMHISGKHKKNKDLDTESYRESFTSLETLDHSHKKLSGQRIGDADPGVMSDEEDDFVFDNLSHKSSASSLSVRDQSNRLPSPNFSSKENISARSRTLPLNSASRRSTNLKPDEWEVKLFGKNLDIGNSEFLESASSENIRSSISLNDDHNDSKQFETVYEVDPISQSSIITETVPEELSKEQKEHNSVHEHENLEVPKALPRSNTFTSSSPVEKKAPVESHPEKDEKIEKKRFSKIKYFRKDKNDGLSDFLQKAPKQFGERIIIGHENNFAKNSGSNASQKEISPEVLKKYEEKSKNELMMLADRLENEVTVQRQRVKELEDYLDDLLLRVMETHPKILQNPYTRNTLTKR